MNDPYKVLGVSPSSSINEIKKAYRDLAKKYHPDNYAGNELADLAAEKMKEINQAYDAIMSEREGTGGSGSWNGSAGGSGSAQYVAVRNALLRGDLDGAQRLLDAMSGRDAEWYFLQGTLQYRRGWFDEAQRNVNQAANMDPGNAEYRQAAAQMNQGAGVFRQSAPGSYGNGAFGNCSMCDCCTAMMCADCLCDCC